LHCVFFTILHSSTIQTLARRHHLPFDHATNRVNAASLFFSFGYVKKTETKKKEKKNRVNAASLFFSFGYVKKTEKKKTKEATSENKAVVSSQSFLNIT
jgi:hypothetical protein